MAYGSQSTFTSDVEFDDPATAVQTANLAFLGEAVEYNFREFVINYADLGEPGALDALSDSYVASQAFQELLRGRFGRGAGPLDDLQSL